jgi:hypothetical protein
MTPFEYVTVLISIILGLGITQIVSGVADLIHHHKQVKLYWPHVLWLVLVFFLHVQEWWQIYELKAYDTWHLPVFLFVILYPIALFILARILFPTLKDEFVDLKAFYFTNFRKFFSFIIIISVLAILENIFIHNRNIEEQLIPLGLLISSTIILTKNIQQEWVHRTFVIILIAIMLISFAVTWNEWLLM